MIPLVILAIILLVGIFAYSVLFRSSHPEPTPQDLSQLPIEIVSTDEPRVIAAVMSAVNVGSMEGERANAYHKVLEEAEVQAILDCIDEGISLHDAETIISRKADYRARATEKFYAND